jgi:Fe2+ or Zn2+ uptake regulation protein
MARSPQTPSPRTTTRREAGEPPDLHTTASQRLKGAGLRYTGSRRRVVAVLDAADRPLTIPEILAADDSLAQSSTYRNLTELIAAGIVHRVVAGDEFSHYELAEELTAHHHHLVCTHCGRVEDFVAADSLEDTLDTALDEVARSHGFEVQRHRLDLVGLCADCA